MKDGASHAGLIFIMTCPPHQFHGLSGNWTKLSLKNTVEVFDEIKGDPNRECQREFERERESILP
jgi:hypothetical protein